MKRLPLEILNPIEMTLDEALQWDMIKYTLMLLMCDLKTADMLAKVNQLC